MRKAASAVGSASIRAGFFGVALGCAVLAALASCAESPAAGSAPLTRHATNPAASPTRHASSTPTGPTRRASTQPAGPTIARCPLFPADNAWRQDISKLPRNTRSDAWVRSIGTSAHLHPDFGTQYGIPYVTVPSTQPKVPITFTDYGDESDPGPYPVPLNAPTEDGADAHVLVASGDCHLYELYVARRSGSGWQAASGAVFDLRSNALRPAGWTSADAAGLPISPGLVRKDEVDAGAIKHALRFTVHASSRGYIAPARHWASSSTDPNVPPMGARFRLRADFDISDYTGEARVVLQALKTYGMIVADNGSNWFLSGAPDPGWNDGDLDQLKRVPGSAFEAVDTGPVVTK